MENVVELFHSSSHIGSNSSTNLRQQTEPAALLQMRSRLVLALMASFFVLHTVSAASLRWRTFKQSAKSLALNTLLLLPSGQPLREIRDGIQDLKDCFASTYDDEAPECVKGPARKVAVSLMVLTDYHFWLWPTDDCDNPDQLAFDVAKRRLSTEVRRDQCSKESKPEI